MIKKGDKFLCKQNYYMYDTRLAYRKGDVYEAPNDKELTSLIDSNHGMGTLDDFFYKHFTPLQEVNNIEVKDSEIVTPKNDPIVSSVMFQLAQRSILGQQKYGTTLQDNNTDDFLQHLKEELMDAILYIEKLQTLKNK